MAKSNSGCVWEVPPYKIARQQVDENLECASTSNSASDNLHEKKWSNWNKRKWPSRNKDDMTGDNDDNDDDDADDDDNIDSNGDIESDEYSNDSELPEEEVDALFEEVFQSLEDKEDSQLPQHEDDERIVLDEKGNNNSEILPEGWIRGIHNSGMPIYLHRPSRVCTMTKPYFPAEGSLRKHRVPLSAIPCLQYLRALREEASAQEVKITGTEITANNTQTSELIGEPSTVQCHNVNAQVSLEQVLNRTATTCDMPGASTATLSLSTDAAPFPSSPTAPDDISTCPVAHSSNLIKEQIRNESTLTDVSSATPPSSMLVDNAKRQTAVETLQQQRLDSVELKEYCQKRFLFKAVKMKKFKTLAERRNYHNDMKKKYSSVVEHPPVGAYTAVRSVRKTRYLIKYKDLYDVNFPKSGGVAKATDSWSKDYLPSNAFGGSGFWSSGAPRDLPKTLWYEFPEPIRVVKYSFTSRLDADYSWTHTDGPSKYIFWASNHDDCTKESHWVILHKDFSGTPFKQSKEPKMENIINKHSYRCYGFKVTEVPGRHGVKPVSIANVHFYSVFGKDSESPNSHEMEWIYNPKGKSYIAILNEYAQNVFKFQPITEFKEVANASTPLHVYTATIIINGKEYCTGYGAGKRSAKIEASKATLGILLPQLEGIIGEGKSQNFVFDISPMEERSLGISSGHLRTTFQVDNQDGVNEFAKPAKQIPDNQDGVCEFAKSAKQIPDNQDGVRVFAKPAKEIPDNQDGVCEFANPAKQIPDNRHDVREFDKQVPVNATAMHPGVLLHSMNPTVQYKIKHITLDNRPHFNVSADIDGTIFTGKGPSVKKAKLALAQEAIRILYGVVSTFEFSS